MTIPEPHHTQAKHISTTGGIQQKKEKKRPAYFFSIIICTYNRCKLLLATLASLQQQTLPHNLFEIIIVDNGSNDGTAEVIEAHVLANQHLAERNGTRQIRYIKEAQNGQAYARNTGLHNARGDVVVFLDDDTLAADSFLACLLAAYNETGADVVGGSVDLLWEAPRPYWFSNDLLEMLGYFQPFSRRTQVSPPISLSKLNFSIKRTLLLEMGGFVPFLGKCLHTPVSIEVAYLCQQMQSAGASIWYDPTIRIWRRISGAQLKRAFLVGRAYWQGRGEIMAIYARQYPTTDQGNKANLTPLVASPAVDNSEATTPNKQNDIALDALLLRDKSTGWYAELREFLLLALIRRPLLSLARKSANERLIAAMGQSYLWGRIRQRLSLVNHAPSTITYPDILLLQANKQDGIQLQQGFQATGLYCMASIAQLPLGWLWRHRRYKGNVAGIIHCYRPGAFQLNYWQRQRFIIRLWLAQHLGIPLVTTDAGGWWQHIRTAAAKQHQAFEQHLFHSSHLILSYSRHLPQLYPDPQLRKRVHALPHPGYYGLIPHLVSRAKAIQQLGWPIPTHPRPFIYLCFAQQHCEQEILSLIEAFSEAETNLSQQITYTAKRGRLFYLIIIGSPCDNHASEKIAQQVTKHNHIHISPKQKTQAIPLYLAASDALVLPHTFSRSAGTLDMAYLWYCYEKVIIVPDLPRFQNIFPVYASLLYDPGNHSSLVQILQRAINHMYQHSLEKRERLDVDKAWQRHAQRIQALHKQLLR